MTVSWDWKQHLCGAAQRIRKADREGPQEVSSETQFSSGTNMPEKSSA